MEPRIDISLEKKLCGINMEMSVTNDRTYELFENFISESDLENTEKYLLQVFPSGYFRNYDPNKLYQNWVLAEIHPSDTIPEEMEMFILKSGLYAIFQNNSNECNLYEKFRFILEVWLPQSGYELDNRPHFEILQENNCKQVSIKEIWVPVKLKQLLRFSL